MVVDGRWQFDIRGRADTQRCGASGCCLNSTRNHDRCPMVRCGGVALWCLFLVFVVGCPTVGPTNVEDGNRDPALSGSIVGSGGEPNGSFDMAIPAIFDATGVARLQGTVSVAGDFDFFSLGALAADDQIVVDVTTPGSALDAAVILFDVDQQLAYTNDDRGNPATPDGLDPYFEFTIPQDSGTYYLVVSNSSLASRGRFAGTYQVNVVVIKPVEDGNRDPALSGSIVGSGGEPNGGFDRPIAALFDATGIARLQGTVSVPGDLDVFSLGAFAAGDEVVVDVTTPGSVLDATVAMFDSEQRLVYTNDDRGNPATSDGLDPYFQFTIRHDSDPYYIVISNSPFAGSGQFTGTYRVNVDITRGGTVPAPVAQILWLEFRGATLESSPLGPMMLAEFVADDISPVYTGQTDVFKELIQEAVAQNYQRFNVVVMTSDDPPPAAGVQYSTVYFGGFSQSLFGIADAVDLYNTDFCDDAIIFAESFSPNIFSRTPSTEQLAIAIGNIASHEAGHLLGLNHVNDDLALMDDQSAADAFLDDQEFILAPLSSDILNIGFQDAALLLYEIVGPNPTP